MKVLNEETNCYERYVRDSIEGIILDKQLSYLKNIKTGIFILSSSINRPFIADWIELL